MWNKYMKSENMLQTNLTKIAYYASIRNKTCFVGSFTIWHHSLNPGFNIHLKFESNILSGSFFISTINNNNNKREESTRDQNQIPKKK